MDDISFKKHSRIFLILATGCLISAIAIGGSNPFGFYCSFFILLGVFANSCEQVISRLEHRIEELEEKQNNSK